MNLKEPSIVRRQQIDNYHASGQTAATWCSENNMNISTLRYWLTKIKREGKTDTKNETFIEFKQSPTKEVPIIVRIGPVSIELYAGFQTETLREVIASIRSL